VSRWTHSICVECWNKKNPDREPIAFKPDFREEDKCCYCSEKHSSGIYVRENPADMPCNGEHP
jgi:hypothetical protein